MSVEKLNKAIAHFRKDSVQSKELLNKYKNLYLKECRVSAQIQKCLQKAQKDLAVQADEITALKKQISILNKRNKSNNRKRWSHVASFRTKRRRLGDLKGDIFKILKDFGSIHTAHVSLKIADHHAHFKWFRKDFYDSCTANGPF